MKSKPTDYLTISMALAAIFLCGYGVGHLLGEKSAREGRAAINFPVPDGKNSRDWELRMFERLDALLELSPSQKGHVREELSRSSLEIKASRNKAMKDYYLHLLSLHQRLPGHLNKAQKIKIEKVTKNLQTNLNLRFSGGS